VTTMTIKLKTDSLRAITAFEKITGVGVRDCLVADYCVYFMVEPGSLGRAIGRNGNSIKELRRVFDKPVKVFEYSETPEGMIKSMVPGASNIEIEDEDARVSIPMENRSEVIGRGGRNIKAIKEFLLRHFKIKRLVLRR
jgi:N utilization substance protein A